MNRSLRSSIFLILGILLIEMHHIAFGKDASAGYFNEARLKTLSQFQGLSSSKITALLKDQNGFIWIGTDNGLNRYDGTSILLFQNNPENENSIGSNRITALLEDQDGRLWIGTKDGLYICSHTDHVFQKQHLSEFGIDFITSICEDKEGNIWIGTNSNLYKYSYENKVYQLVDFIEHNIPDNPNLGLQLLTDRQGELWIGSWQLGIYRMNPITWEFVRFGIPTHMDHDILREGRITDIEEGPDGSLWFAGYGFGLMQISLDRNSAKIYSHSHNNSNSLNSNKIKSLEFDDKGYLWIGIEESGLDRFAPEAEDFTHFFSEFQSTDIYEGPSVYSIMIDDQSLMWLGFRNDGVKIVPLENPSFEMYSKENESMQVLSICETKQGIYLGTRGAIELFDNPSQTYLTYQLPNNETPIALHNYDDKTLFIGTYRGSLWKFNTLTKKFHRFSNSGIADELSGYKIECFYKLPNHQLLIGTQRGMYRLDLLSGDYKKVIYSDNQYNWIHNIQSGYEESIWALSWGDFYRYFPQTGKLIRHQTDAEGDIKTSYFTPDNQIVYLGTDLGFYTQNLNSTEANRFKDIFPFINNQANAMVVDNQNNFWITSENGLIFYSPSANKFRTFNEEDGLPKMRFYDGVGTKLKNGKIAFGGDQGILIFDPLKIDDRPNNANLTFTGLTILNEEFHVSQPEYPFAEDISEIDELELKYRQNIITFHFSLLSYINPSKHRYRYVLEGFNDNWFDLGNQNSVTFTNLDPGEYILKIQAANEENNWSPMKELKISVSPPITQTWYAYLIYGAILIGIYLLIMQFYKNREKLKSRLRDEHMNFEKIKAKAKHESEFSQMRLKFFTNISHEFRTPLTLILGPLENFIKKQKWPNEEHLKLMHKNAERLQRLINQILDFRSLENKHLQFEPSWGNITQFVKETAQLFVPLAQQKGLHFELANNTKDVYAWFDRDKVEKIIYNLLSNAHKHTQRGKIEFTINSYDRSNLPYKSKKWRSDEYDLFIEFVVVDSGDGIPEDKLPHIFDRFYHLQSNNSSVQGTGIGLTLTKELLEIHNGKIKVNSKLKKGSEFKVILPLKTSKSSEKVLLDQVEELDDEANISLNMLNGEEQLEEKTEKLPVILIVEDNEDLRQYIKVEFGSKFKIIEADNGATGLDIALKDIPDLIISDLMMPEMDGIEFCKEIKKDQRTSHIPIIILTAHSSQFNKIKGYEIGADDYITKPFSSELLVLRIENLLKGRKELQNKFSREVRLEPKDLPISNMDERFLTKAMEVVEANLNDSEFNADSFASEMCMSRVHLYRKLKALTDQSVSDFVKTARLKLAANLIGENKLTIKEAAYTVGFKDPKYFSKCFKQQFGVKPSEYVIDDEPADNMQ